MLVLHEANGCCYLISDLRKTRAMVYYHCAVLARAGEKILEALVAKGYDVAMLTGAAGSAKAQGILILILFQALNSAASPKITFIILNYMIITINDKYYRS
jgi:hypothetical protein